MVDAVAALGIHILRQITGQGSDDLDLLPGQKFRQVRLIRLLQNSQIAAIQDPAPQGAGFGHQASERGIELGCPTGEVEGRNPGLLDEGQHGVDDRARHDLLTGGSSIDMATPALLVTAVTQIDL